MDRPDAEPTPGVRLGVVTELVHKLHDAGVGYCHWKSNEHLRESMEGLTDLDVLVDREACLELSRALAESGFKQFTAAPAQTYPGIEDYLARDPDTGRLVHLHLHQQLTLGEKHLKGYHLPWESLILSTRRFDQDEGIYVADPGVETLLLMVRSALKLRARDLFMGALGRRYFDRGTLAELAWLKERMIPEELAHLSEQLLGPDATRALKRLLEDQRPSLRGLVSFRRRILPRLAVYSTYGRFGSTWRMWLRELAWVRRVLNKRYIHAAIPCGRTNPRGGVVIALMGCDGSGKSTVLEQTSKWLSQKLDVIPVYLGSGGGSSSWLRWPLKFSLDLYLKLTGHRSDRRPSATDDANRRTKTMSRAERTFRVVYALILSHEKRSKLRKVTRARNRGLIVISDRYPQCQIMGYNDGPLLSHWLDHESAFYRALARWERVPYRWPEDYPPDVVIKLHVTPEVAQQRTEPMRLDDIRRKVEAIRTLQYPSRTTVIDIDADQPLEHVLQEVSRRVWQEL